jgi:hypothetical protein
MKRTLISFAFALLISFLFSTVWHVNNVPNMTANFSDLNTAANSPTVADEDTIYVYGSSLTYGDTSISRPLTIIGPGFFLNENMNLQSNITSAVVNSITLNSGAEGSVIAGMRTVEGGYINVTCSNVVVQRNHIFRIMISASNTVVIQNYFISTDYYTNSVEISAGSNQIVANNFMYHAYYNVGRAFWSNTGVSVQVYNNVIRGNCEFRGAEVFNNIFAIPLSSSYLVFTLDAGSTLHHNVMENNIDWSPYAALNIIDHSFSEIFVPSGTSDSQYQLNATSPALGGGVNGTDCGMFGGMDPYRLSGIPAIPTIYQFYAPSTGFTIPVQIRARSNN